MDFEIVAKVDGEELDIIQELLPDMDNLNEDFIRQPSIVAWIGILLSKAEYEYEVCRMLRKGKEGELYERFLQEATEKKEKTSDMRAQFYINNHTEYKAAKTAELDAKKRYSDIQALNTGYISKGSSLISLGANQRTELNSYNSVIKDVKREPKTASKLKKIRETIQGGRNGS